MIRPFQPLTTDKSALCIWQQSPIYTHTHTHTYTWQNSPVYVAKEPEVYSRRGLLVLGIPGSSPTALRSWMYSAVSSVEPLLVSPVPKSVCTCTHTHTHTLEVNHLLGSDLGIKLVGRTAPRTSI